MGSLATSTGLPRAICWPKFKNHHTIADIHDYAHDVLDNQDADAEPLDFENQLDGLVGFGGVEPGHHFIEKKQGGLQGQGLADLESLTTRQGQVGG
jgi:hypothetical protein